MRIGWGGSDEGRVRDSTLTTKHHSSGNLGNGKNRLLMGTDVVRNRNGRVL